MTMDAEEKVRAKFVTCDIVKYPHLRIVYCRNPRPLRTPAKRKAGRKVK